MAIQTHHDTELELDTPKQYNVFLLNDDYSPMDFVVDILISLFHKTYEEAEAITILVHQKGKGLCGTFSYEIAETKVMQVTQKARDKGFPLKATMEEV